MKLRENVTYLLNLAPGWFVRCTVVEAHPPTDGAGGHYTVSDYAYVDFADAPFTDSFTVRGGVEKVRGVVVHKVPDDALPSVSDAMIIQSFVLK